MLDYISIQQELHHPSYFRHQPSFRALLSHFANCKDHHLDSFTYLCDVFRRIKNTAKEDLVYLLEHRWQPMPALALA